MAKINRQLNLVIPIEQGESTIYAHATPVSSETFDSYFLTIAKAFSAIYSEGLGIIAGPRVAHNVLRKVSEELGNWDEIKRGLINEIHRLTNVFAPQDKGWQMIPYDDAVRTGVIDAEDVGEIESALVFFTLSWHMHKRNAREEILQGASALWGAQITSLSCTEYRDSLPTLTAGENTGENQG